MMRRLRVRRKLDEKQKVQVSTQELVIPVLGSLEKCTITIQYDLMHREYAIRLCNPAVSGWLEIHILETELRTIGNVDGLGSNSAVFRHIADKITKSVVENITPFIKTEILRMLMCLDTDIF